MSTYLHTIFKQQSAEKPAQSFFVIAEIKTRTEIKNDQTQQNI